MDKSNAQIDVVSYLARNWGGSYKRPPGLILNPDAHYLELLAWCWGEVQVLLASADVCINGNSELQAGDMSAIFLSRLRPLAEVIEVAIDAGMLERQTRDAACAVKGATHV